MRTLNSEPKNRGWIVGIVIVIAIAVVCLGGMYSCSSMFERTFGAFDPDSDLAFAGEDCVAVIDIDGTIQYDYSACSPEGLSDLLDSAESNDRIKAVVLRIDSGGGVATAGEEMSEYVKQFSKPIVVSSASTNASAAYEISSQADYIFTAKTTAIGSIGVAMQITDLSGLYEMLGINIENITSDDSKEATYGTRPLTQEERDWYQAMVDQINDLFINTVADGRGMEYDEVKALANGMVYTGIDAVDNGLADEIGNLEDAVSYAADLAGYDDLPYMYLEEDSSDISDFLDLMSEYGSSLDQAVPSKSRVSELIAQLRSNRAW